MARHDPWDAEYVELLDDYDEGDKWIDELLSSPPPGMCGTQNWYHDEHEDTPEQTVADMIENEERWNKG